MPDHSHKTRTLWLAGVLHAFTHVYHVALMPLYLPIQKDFQLASVSQVTLLVTVMMYAYFLPSYPMGMLADRVSRKKLLATGLLINALGFIGLSLAPNYPTALACVVVAGFGGSFFHPAATAMIARLYPVGTGKALGFLGIGASVGFFVSPIYTGWRAEASGWRMPVLELGILGVVVALLFAWLAEEEKPMAAVVRPVIKAPRAKLFPTAALWIFFIAAGLCFSLRDFTGASMATLGSLFLQKAHGYNLKSTGLALSAIFLMSMVSNPLFGGLSDRARLRWTAFVLVVAAVTVAIFPHMSSGWVAPTFMIYGFFFMASYPMVEAALMESVPDAVRGRVFGLFITIGGMTSNLSHWFVGRWVEDLKSAATSAVSFYPIYSVLGLLVLCSTAGLLCLQAIRKREQKEVTPEAAPASQAAPGSPD